MNTGTIKSIKADRGFGFIRVPNEGDLFFHITSLVDAVPFDETLIERRVEFTVQMHNGRERAANVKLLEN